MSPRSAMRGEVWICAFPQPPRGPGPHPVVVLTVNGIAEPLSAVTVAVITGTSGPSSTHIPVGPDSGLTKYDESYINCTDIQTVDKSRLRNRRGLLAPSEMEHVEERIRVILGL